MDQNLPVTVTWSFEPTEEYLTCFLSGPLPFFKALINTTDQQIYCDLVAGEEDNTFLKE